MIRWLYLCCGFLLAWVLGFVYFLHHIYHFPSSSKAPQAIAVLTGGQERIKEGLHLLDRHPKAILLISGVHTDRYLKEVRRYVQHQRNIKIGFQATTTAENAQEVRDWLPKHIQAVHVVTSHYHMDRSLLELQQAMPHIIFHPHAVVSHQYRQLRWVGRPRNWHLLLKEYTKYLIIYAYFKLKQGYHAGRHFI